jgi:DNA-binding response OmpR family regulator
MPHDCPLCGQPITDLPVTIYRERGMAVAGGKFALLTGSETDVLTILARAFPRIVTKQAIMDGLYGDQNEEPDIKIVDVFICKLRKKIAPLGVEIDTAWGNGYGLRVQKKPVIIEAAA